MFILKHLGAAAVLTAMSSVIALLPEGANRAPVRFRMTSSNQENGFVGLARQRAISCAGT